MVMLLFCLVFVNKRLPGHISWFVGGGVVRGGWVRSMAVLGGLRYGGHLVAAGLGVVVVAWASVQRRGSQPSARQPRKSLGGRLGVFWVFWVLFEAVMIAHIYSILGKIIIFELVQRCV